MNYLSDFAITNFIRLALSEDVGDGDHSSLASIDPNHKSKALVVSKDEGVIAGVSLAERIFLLVDNELTIKSNKKEGDQIHIGEELIHIQGRTQSILKAERLALNCLQRMSGIASYTRKIITMIGHTNCQVLDTRKTTPNFRMMEKWAVLIGGGTNHRYNLSDLIMLKDNHIDNAGGIMPAVTKAKAYIAEKELDLEIEVETRDLDEVQQVLDVGGVKRVMFDNFEIDQVRAGVALVKGELEVEVSGGVTEDTVKELAETGVDYISMGALTHSYKSLDLSLKAEAL